jgi:tetratricopeptide (TPR) repeat protein
LSIISRQERNAVRRLWKRSVLVTALAAAVLLGAGVFLGPLRHRGAAGTATATTQASPTGALDAFVTKTTEHLHRVPRDWQSWAELGLAQVQLARVSFNPAHYPLAESALRRSLAVRPTGNAAAETGLGALAAAKHDFRAALVFARRAVAADPYSADAYGVLTDAYVELGRYPEAKAAVQRMLNLRPDTSSYSRASYLFELHGDLKHANELMETARADATDPADITFCLLHLGELAFGAGNLDQAAADFGEGLTRQPGVATLLADRAKVEAARGELPAAITDLRAATGTLPTVDHLVTLSDVLRAAGNTGEATRTDDEVRISARLPGATPASTDIDLILFYADHGDPRAAVAKARALLAARPGVIVETAYGWALHSAGRDREALVHANRGLRLGTRDAKSYYYRGMIRLALHDRTGARADLREALQINPYFSLRYAPAAKAALTKLGRAS